MTTIDEAVEEGSCLPETEGPESTAGGRARASSIPLPSLDPLRKTLTHLKPVTERARKAGAVIGLTVGFLAALINKPGSLVHAQPPTFTQARDRHHECAGHLRAPLLRYPRYIWGYFHLMVIKPLLNGLEWDTESPLRFIITAAIVTLIWVFS